MTMSRTLSTAVLRRILARLRVGEIIPGDPDLSPQEAIQRLEKEIAWRETLRTIIVEGDAYLEQLAKTDVQRERRRVAAFHRLKKSPEATDPQSPAAQRLQRIHRLRRRTSRRSRS